MIEIKNLNKYYNAGSQRFHALKNINLTFPDKGLVFIVGKSGSGKSTLLNIIGGIDSYDSGELIVDNLNTKKFTKKDYNSYRNSYVGFIFQEFNVVKNLNVYDNISLSLRLKNEPIKQNNTDLINDIIDKVGLTGKAKRKMNQLSGGERQRVAIARALVKKPNVVIADEPTGNLDKKNRDIVMDTLKKISKDKLVIVVTHDKELSSKYGDAEIVLKDGEVIKNTCSSFEKNSDVLCVKPVQPGIKTSIFLSLKSLKQNIMRFIFITLFFTVSLVFANTSINLYFSNATSEYANFQNQYNNQYITISQKKTLYDKTFNTGFFQIDTSNYENLINSLNDEDSSFKIYKTFQNNIDISKYATNIDEIDDLYYDKIKNIIVFEDIDQLKNDYEVRLVDNTQPSIRMPIRCYITDYVAECLIQYNYFNQNFSDFDTYENYFADKTIVIPGFRTPIYIEGIITTNYSLFLDSDLNDPNVYASFKDNLSFYSSILFKSSIYVGAENESQFISTNNIYYCYDNFIYSVFNNTGKIDNVKVTSYNDSIAIKVGKKPERKLEQSDSEQIAISTGLFKQMIDTPLEEFIVQTSYPYGLINPNTNAPAIFSFYGYSRVYTYFSSVVVGIIENDEPVIYCCNNSENTNYYNYLKTSFSDFDNSSKNYGGYMTILITNDVAKNTNLYQILRNNNITIDNLSYTKLQVVNEFIDQNLFIFLGIFFALCMFSILMIFNFVVITIKNSTKDIGIYMSLGMNGFKISFIYLFQILIVSTISFIVSSIGAIVFLRALDSSLSQEASSIINAMYGLNLAPINFDIFKITSSGIGVALVLAYIVPLLTIIIPLVDLARKKPIDILKVS